MGEVQNKPFEADLPGTLCSRDERVADADDVLFGHGARNSRQITAKGDRRRRDRVPAAPVRLDHMIVAFPGPIGARLAARMANLDARYGAVLLDGSNRGRQRLGLRVVPEAKATRRNPAFR